VPLIFAGLAVLAVAGGIALWAQHNPPAPYSPNMLSNEAGAGSGGAYRTDAAASATVSSQTVSAVSKPETPHVDPRAMESPDRFADSPAAPASPIVSRTTEPAFADYSEAPVNDEIAGYTVNDIAQEDWPIGFAIDDINKPRDISEAPGAPGGVPAEWK
jgi:hypothetical protein